MVTGGSRSTQLIVKFLLDESLQLLCLLLRLSATHHPSSHAPVAPCDGETPSLPVTIMQRSDLAVRSQGPEAEPPRCCT